MNCLGICTITLHLSLPSWWRYLAHPHRHWQTCDLVLQTSAVWHNSLEYFFVSDRKKQWHQTVSWNTFNCNSIRKMSQASELFEWIMPSPSLSILKSKPTRVWREYRLVRSVMTIYTCMHCTSRIQHNFFQSVMIHFLTLKILHHSTYFYRII